jgi:hypothetical protein
MNDEALAGLDALIQDAKPDERPGLLVVLAARLATLGARLIPGRPASKGAADPELRITPDRAAEIAAVSRRRVYEWARGERWASRPSRKTLRISERGFRAWIAAR